MLKSWWFPFLVILFLPEVSAFDWGDFHKMAVIFFSFLGPMVILGALLAVAYFACIKSWYEGFREDVHETHRSYHPWPAGSARWQLQQFVNSAKGLPSKLLPPYTAEQTQTSYPVQQAYTVPQKTATVPPHPATLAQLAITQPPFLLSQASPQTTYTVAVDPNQLKQVPYTSAIRPKSGAQSTATPRVETIFSPSGPSITYPPSIIGGEQFQPMSAPQKQQYPVPISVITDSSYYPPTDYNPAPILRGPSGGNLLYSQGHDFGQTYPRSSSAIDRTQRDDRNFLSPTRTGDYRVQSPSPNYAALSPNARMQAVFVRTTTTTHRKTVLSPTRGYSVV